LAKHLSLTDPPEHEIKEKAGDHSMKYSVRKLDVYGSKADGVIRKIAILFS
jgi:hypothetical protein